MTASDKKKLAKLKANLSELKNRYKNKTISKKEYDKKYKYIKAQIDKINKKYSKKKNVSFKDKAKNAKRKRPLRRPHIVVSIKMVKYYLRHMMCGLVVRSYL